MTIVAIIFLICVLTMALMELAFEGSEKITGAWLMTYTLLKLGSLITSGVLAALVLVS
jgi:hypothetical protein